MNYREAYTSHKYYTTGRFDKNGNPIEFRLSYEDWLSVWIKSGHINERGHCKGQYCMSRIDDLGHYELGNVFIQLFSENARQGNLGRKGYWTGKGKGSFSGQHHTNETKEKLRLLNVGKTISEETKLKISSAVKGRKQTPEQIAKRVASRLNTLKLRKEVL